MLRRRRIILLFRRGKRGAVAFLSSLWRGEWTPARGGGAFFFGRGRETSILFRKRGKGRSILFLMKEKGGEAVFMYNFGREDHDALPSSKGGE